LDVHRWHKDAEEYSDNISSCIPLFGWTKGGAFHTLSSIPIPKSKDAQKAQCRKDMNPAEFDDIRYLILLYLI
jgi:hypothetical protein